MRLTDPFTNIMKAEKNGELPTCNVHFNENRLVARINFLPESDSFLTQAEFEYHRNFQSVLKLI